MNCSLEPFQRLYQDSDDIRIYGSDDDDYIRILDIYKFYAWVCCEL